MSACCTCAHTSAGAHFALFFVKLWPVLTQCSVSTNTKVCSKVRSCAPKCAQAEIDLCARIQNRTWKVCSRLWARAWTQIVLVSEHVPSLVGSTCLSDFHVCMLHFSWSEEHGANFFHFLWVNTTLETKIKRKWLKKSICKNIKYKR